MLVLILIFHRGDLVSSEFSIEFSNDLSSSGYSGNIITSISTHLNGIIIHHFHVQLSSIIYKLKRNIFHQYVKFHISHSSISGN